MCFGLHILSSIFGDGGKQAKATAAAADQDAQAQRWAAQASAQALETSIARNKAAENAATVLSQPVEDVNVSVDDQDDKDYTPDSGRRRTRSAFRASSTPQSSLRI